MEVNTEDAEYTEYAEREFESEGGLRDAYNAVLDLLEDTQPGDMECDCADRSWYGAEHDSMCPLAGQPNPNSLLKEQK
jgi:hypothetical protein